MTDLPPIPRPNGKLYRPRKLRAYAWDNEDFLRGVVVLGIHDVERARVMARAACALFHDMPHAIGPEVGWFRLGIRSGERTWVEDEIRGAAGVWFTASDDPEEAP